MNKVDTVWTPSSGPQYTGGCLPFLLSQVALFREGSKRVIISCSDGEENTLVRLGLPYGGKSSQWHELEWYAFLPDTKRLQERYHDIFEDEAVGQSPVLENFANDLENALIHFVDSAAAFVVPGRRWMLRE